MTVFILCFRHWIRNMHNWSLRRHALQHNHCLGSLLPLCFIPTQTPLGWLWKWLEHRKLHSGSRFGESHQLWERDKPRERILRVSPAGAHAQFGPKSYLSVPGNYNGELNLCRRSLLELHKSEGFGDLGNIKWSLVLCLLAVFLLVYFSLWKGVRSTGKVI